ncbi:BTAD domain-containing putative transcriptional regulator [Dactylosporangium sp. CA-139066]|uniref:BTAD domain-containing putative transcriptional regulator n=1 Tax=Dactylosporangium sp. CA-139066 TaxID=3239930 RepID=UPI003D8B9E44
MPVRIRVLGPTRAVLDDVELDLGGRRPAEVLTLLAAAHGAPVPAEVLVDRLWRGHPPGTALTTLQGFVARLRRLLEPGRSAREAGILVTRGAGYALELPPGAVDADRFADLVGSARAAAATGRAADAASRYADALDLWSGTPYADVADVMDVQPLVVRLEELRLAAVDELAEIRLAAGQGAGLVPELTRIAAAHPLREGAQALLARALYQAGRQADALEVLRRVRGRLADELGLDASAQLAELESAILRRDPALTPPRPDATPDVVRPAPAAAEGGFVGRQAELAALEAAWAGAAAGRGTAVVVTGEPGIGKTRLVEVFAGRVGAAARWGRCSPSGGAPPYWPWQQILHGLPEGASRSDAGARFALGLEVVRRLRVLAGAAPLLVVIDDLQWADPDSSHVLEIVLGELRDLPLLLVLTCRPDAAGDPVRVLAVAARSDGARRLALTGLSAEEVGHLAGALGAPGRDPAAVAALAARSGGNPFFVTELAALPPGELPGSIRDVLRLRLAALSPAGTDVLAAVAVAGGSVPLATVASVLDRPAGALGADVQVALRAALLVEPAPGRVRVAHDLVREVVLADLDPARRSVLHRSWAEALAAGPAAATSAAAIAMHHCAAAAGAPDVPAAVAVLRAAREALARAGDAEAEELAANGLRHVPEGEPGLRADLHEVRGAALRRLGRLEESSGELRAAAELARRHDDPQRLARAALASAGGGVGGYWACIGAPAATDVPLLDEAVSRAGDLPPVLRSAVLAALAVQRASAGYDDGLDLAAAATRAVDGADGTRAVADAGAARARAAVAEFVARWTPDRANERAGLARAMLAGSGADHAYRATALHLLRCALTETGRFAEAAAVSRRYAELADRHGDGDLLLLDTWWRAGLALAQGDYATARRLGDGAVAAAPTHSPAAADVTRMSRQTVEGIIAWHEHRLFEVVPEVVDLAVTVDPDWLSVLAQAYAQAGRRDDAYAAIDRLTDHPGGGVREPVRTILLADVYLELGDAQRAAALLPALRSYGDTVIVLWAGTTILGPASLYRGGVLALLGDPAAAAELDRAERVCAEFGFAPFARRVETLRRALGTRR